MAEILDEDAAGRRASAVLSRLAALGVQAGDRVAVLAGNGAAFVAARDAATAADLMLAPINPRLAPAEIAWIVALRSGLHEPKLIGYAQAFEQATQHRVPPASTPSLAGR